MAYKSKYNGTNFEPMIDTGEKLPHTNKLTVVAVMAEEMFVVADYMYSCHCKFRTTRTMHPQGDWQELKVHFVYWMIPGTDMREHSGHSPSGKLASLSSHVDQVSTEMQYCGEF